MDNSLCAMALVPLSASICKHNGAPKPSATIIASMMLSEVTSTTVQNNPSPAQMSPMGLCRR